ncbi:hypothetical protein EJ04DRAFT_560930 [Polyplosphaeria fusca]|uniref:Uncharacterized protein n=1 Tax=Polyplosphaeria fusca TaxID=682080 RepID=A0A9P4V691_9PLEO|nr:hypothetical protein EJ04DRAFT_560930 [Polyplosphaeria fusca]
MSQPGSPWSAWADQAFDDFLKRGDLPTPPPLPFDLNIARRGEDSPTSPGVGDWAPPPPNNDDNDNDDNEMRGGDSSTPPLPDIYNILVSEGKERPRAARM